MVGAPASQMKLKLGGGRRLARALVVQGWEPGRAQCPGHGRAAGTSWHRGLWVPLCTDTRKADSEPGPRARPPALSQRAGPPETPPEPTPLAQSPDEKHRPRGPALAVSARLNGRFVLLHLRKHKPVHVADRPFPHQLGARNPTSRVFSLETNWGAGACQGGNPTPRREPGPLRSRIMNPVCAGVPATASPSARPEAFGQGPGSRRILDRAPVFLSWCRHSVALSGPSPVLGGQPGGGGWGALSPSSPALVLKVKAHISAARSRGSHEPPGRLVCPRRGCWLCSWGVVTVTVPLDVGT